MTVFVWVVSALMAVAVLAWIVSLFVRDGRIREQGRDVVAHVDEVRVIAVNESDSKTLGYRLSWEEDGRRKQVRGRETIPMARVAEIREGDDVVIRYLDDDNIRFVFDR